MDHRLEHKIKKMKLIEKTLEENFCDFDVGKYFFKGRQNSKTNPAPPALALGIHITSPDIQSNTS